MSEQSRRAHTEATSDADAQAAAPHGPATGFELRSDGFALRLFHEETLGAVRDAAAAAAAADRICFRITMGLSRSFGRYGAQALTTRAVARARGSHPVLKAVSITEDARIIGLSESADVHGVPAVVDALVAIVAALTELLTRLIGEDLAVSLLEQSSAPRPATFAPAPLTLSKP